MSSYHILFLNWRDTSNPEGGGSEVYVEQIASELVAAGHRATILCAAHSNGPAQEVRNDVTFLRRGGRRTVYLRAALTYLAGLFGLGALGKAKVDVIVDVCNGVPFLSVFYARCPVVVLAHHVHREQWPIVLGRWRAAIGWWIESKLAVWAYRKCWYVTVSEATRNELGTLGVEPRRISVVHNGTPLPQYEAVVRSSDPLLVVLGRLVPHKRVEVALWTVAALRPEIPGLRLVVAGQGWWDEKLRQLADSLEIGDAVTFTGFVDDERKHELLGQAWVALAPSLKEGWGLTIVEAGIRGTPSIAFRGAGGVEESLVDGVSGLLAADEAEFVEHVRRLMTDHELRRTMGAAAVLHGRSFDWTTSGKLFEAVVLEAL